MYKPESHEVGERFKLIMRRMTARNVWNDPNYITRAQAAIPAIEAERSLNDINGQSWGDFWREMLDGPKTDLCRLLSSRDPKDVDITRYSPFKLEWMGTIFQDEVWRMRAIQKAKIGIISLQASLSAKGDPRANHQFLWSEVNDELARKQADAVTLSAPTIK